MSFSGLKISELEDTAKIIQVKSNACALFILCSSLPPSTYLCLFLMFFLYVFSCACYVVLCGLFFAMCFCLLSFSLFLCTYPSLDHNSYLHCYLVLFSPHHLCLANWSVYLDPVCSFVLCETAIRFFCSWSCFSALRAFCLRLYVSLCAMFRA